jgi:formate-dependent phosphoribosylglycinamide formyltransferase (GAR transformylase)
VLKKAKDKATLILVGSAELYRELAISAFRLVPRR